MLTAVTPGSRPRSVPLSCSAPRRRSARRPEALLAVAAATISLAACSDDPATGPASNDQRGSRELVVLAAASLQGAFTTIGAEFEARQPGVEVTLSFGPSSGLAAQVTNGAPADVFASASEPVMAPIAQAGLVNAPVVFATNSMQIAVPRKNPAGIDDLDDLDDPRVKIAVCQAAVPCGSGAATVFEKAGITPTPVSEETDVKAVLTKVTLGEVDAGLVYVTDVLAARSKVRGVPIPGPMNVTTNYPIATVVESANAKLAQQFVTLVTSEGGQQVLRQAGFTSP